MGAIGVKWQDRRKDSRFALGDRRNLSTDRPGFACIGGFHLLIFRFLNLSRKDSRSATTFCYISNSNCLPIK
jgi:hypothetical protein